MLRWVLGCALALTLLLSPVALTDVSAAASKDTASFTKGGGKKGAKGKKKGAKKGKKKGAGKRKGGKPAF